jgi:hypothetical protein
MIPGDPITGLRAAQARADRLKVAEDAEEEAMTQYTPQDLATDWEFKIIRSAFKQFGVQAIRERILAEENHAGWVLVEVFDDARIRLKRQRRSHPLEPIEGYDPYRTQIPLVMTPATRTQNAVGCAILGCLIVGAAVAVFFATGVFR